MKEIEMQLNERKVSIENLLEKRFKAVILQNPNGNGRKVFTLNNGEVFCIDTIKSFGCLVIEHSESIEEAEKLTLEDGGLYYIGDYQSIEDMLADMLKEINE